MRDDFAVFILSHGRAENVITWATLDKCGYTGKRYVIIDDEDDQEPIYRARYGQAVIQFCKAEAAKRSDTMDCSKERNIVLFARNECHRIAKELGLEYFLVLDDDYTDFQYRYVKDNRLLGKRIEDFDGLCDEMIDFLETSGALTVALAQGCDFIGGFHNGRLEQGLLRKAMNSFFCKTDRPFLFLGRINEDTNAYVLLGSRGYLFFTVCRAMLTQVQTQKQAGGLTDTYLDHGTYVKSFYSVICMPSAVVVNVMGAHHRRMHHRVNWSNCVPEILSERWRK